MKDSLYLLKNERDESLNIKENLHKYLVKWPWFLAFVILCFIVGIVYIRYAPKMYESVAKIKIIDDSIEFDVASDPLSLLGNGSNVNLTNEIQVLKSFRLMKQVIDHLALEIAYYEVGSIKTRQVYKSPVIATISNSKDSIYKKTSYEISILSETIKITNSEGKEIVLDNDPVVFEEPNFSVKFERNHDFEFNEKMENDFFIEINSKKKAILNLIEKLQINPAEQNSDILALKLKYEDPELSEAILNEIVRQFNLDGIKDRQLIHKRTLDFIEDRFVFLTTELDSIETNKKDYKQENSLSYIEADAEVTIEKKSITESELFKIGTQIQLSNLLEKSLTASSNFDLLPADIGLENTSINRLVFEYNELVLERKKLITSAGDNNPTVVLLTGGIEQTKSNILKTIKAYQQQLRISRQQLQQESSTVGNYFSSLPEKEKILRSIERQQIIKENLFLLLLQKREEAAINFAVTSPTIKIVDYALTSSYPVSPNNIVILGLSLLLGILIPLGIFYTKFILDTKIHDRTDIENFTSKIPVLGEIPSFISNKIMESNDRSILAESFRILSTNFNYLLPDNNTSIGKVIYVTSAVKGEGKTLTAFNLSFAYSTLKKRVLLIGSDLRNPQLHSYLKTSKNSLGLSDYLHNTDIEWEDCINNHTDNSFHKTCFSGPIPPNAPELLSSTRFTEFIKKSKQEFDYIIIDTAPTLLVTDTLLISQHADATLFVTRANYTDKRLLEFSKNLYHTKKLQNMAYIVNDVDSNKFKGYNYGYGYGYSNQEMHNPWHKGVLNKLKSQFSKSKNS